MNSLFEPKKITALTSTGWKNVVGSANRKCSCGNWLKHWENFSEDIPLFCSVEGCNELATDGAHVYNTAKLQGEWIVPMCHECNENTDTFSLSVGTIIVSANKSETCEKK